jgi:hypothetical protein
MKSESINDFLQKCKEHYGKMHITFDIGFCHINKALRVLEKHGFEKIDEAPKWFDVAILRHKSVEGKFYLTIIGVPKRVKNYAMIKLKKALKLKGIMSLLLSDEEVSRLYRKKSERKTYLRKSQHFKLTSN